MKIAVTGAGGFIGSALCQYLTANGHQIWALSRGELEEPNFAEHETVIHCAALAHRTGTERPSDDGLPIGYIDKYNVYHEITQFDAQNPVYGHLKNSATAYLNDKREQVYGYLNFSIAKEIKKNLRIAINAYNFLNLKYQEVYVGSTGTTTYDNFINPVSVTAGLTIKF